jgi:iron-sulfur cluster repair protein YtfE (RIC family)
MRTLSFADVERTVLAQHDEIRARLRGLVNCIARFEAPAAPASVRMLLPRFAAHFESHLGFEERELAPRIRSIDAWGPVRESMMLAEHRAQRSRIEAVCALVETLADPQPALLTTTVTQLVSELLDDMRHEEQDLEALRQIDEYGHVDHMTG